jgi:hypothetical protein
MKTHETEQHAYAGQYSIRHKVGGYLIAGKTGFDAGGTIRKPRLYETATAAEEAAEAITWADCEAVRLVAKPEEPTR